MKAQMKPVLPIRNAKGELNISSDALMMLMGHGPKAKEVVREGNLIWSQWIVSHPWGEEPQYTMTHPYQIAEVAREYHFLMATVRCWIHENLRGFKRHVKLGDWEAYQLWKLSSTSNFTIVRCKVGDTVEIPRSHGSHFGSGGAWGKWQVYGEVTQKVTDQKNNGFVLQDKVAVTFNHGPAAVFTASGDDIGKNGRVFYRTLYVAE